MSNANNQANAEAEAKAKAEAEAKAKAEAEAEAKAKAGKGYEVLEPIRCGGSYYTIGDVLPEDQVSKKDAAKMRKKGLIK